MKNAAMTIVLACALASFLPGCKKSETEESGDAPKAEKKATSDTHAHADGSTHAEHGAGKDEAEGHDHAQDEVPLRAATIGDLKVEFAQGHGKIQAGKEGHLVVKLSYNDQGATTVRAWIGTKDRLKSVVGKGEYAPSHNDYDVHAVAPDPLPENTMWWIEIEKPDGTKHVGSTNPLM